MDHPQTDNEQAVVTQHYEGVSWIDIQNPSSEVFADLEKKYNLHPVHLNESIQKVQFNQVEREEHYTFLLLHVPVYDAHHDRIDVDQVGVFLGDDYLITIHSEPSDFISDLLGKCDTSDSHKEEYFKKGSAYLLYCLIKDLLDHLSAIGQDVLNQLDSIEYMVFDDSKSDAYQIGKVRQKIIRLKRIVSSLRIILDDLSQQIKSSKWDHLAKYYANNVKSANKLLEVVEEAKETIEIFKDADFTTSTERTNRTLALLTLIFTFTIPITVVAGLYGMNVPLPGGIQTGAWSFLGTYTTLWIALCISAAAAGFMYLYFRMKRWF